MVRLILIRSWFILFTLTIDNPSVDWLVVTETINLYQKQFEFRLTQLGNEFLEIARVLRMSVEVKKYNFEKPYHNLRQYLRD